MFAVVSDDVTCVAPNFVSLKTVLFEFISVFTRSLLPEIVTHIYRLKQVFKSSSSMQRSLDADLDLLPNSIGQAPLSDYKLIKLD